MMQKGSGACKRLSTEAVARADSFVVMMSVLYWNGSEGPTWMVVRVRQAQGKKTGLESCLHAWLAKKSCMNLVRP